MARALLKKPRWLFLDEATEQTLCERLQALVMAQGGALISIAHRPGAAAFHQQRWTLVDSDGGDSRFKVEPG